MSIALFVISLFINIFILLIVKFVYASNYSYTEGMLLGVHIPKEHCEDEDVLSIVAISRHRMNLTLWINLILGTALCFVIFWEIIIFILIYTVWMIAFCFQIVHVNNSSHRKTYALKLSKNWVIPNESGDDEYWKTGYYYNPSDSRVLVPNQLQSGSYSFNFATKAAKFWTAFISISIVAGIVLTAYLLIPFINVSIDCQLEDDILTVSAAGYSTEVSLEDIEEVRLLEELPDDHFSRTNGGVTEEYLIGHFKGSTYGRCEMYIYRDSHPLLMIKTKDTYIFLNTQNSGDTYSLYKSINPTS